MTFKRYAQSGKPVLTKDERTVRSIFCNTMNDFREKKYLPKLDYASIRIPSWDGGKTPTGRVYRGHIWGRMLEFVTRNKLDAADYFNWFFGDWKGSGLPFPNYAMSQAKAAEYLGLRGTKRTTTQAILLRNDLQMLLERLPQAVITECNNYGGRITPERATIYVLCQCVVVRDPVLNYAAAYASGIAEAVRMLQDVASERFKLRKDQYLEALPDLFVGALRTALETNLPEETT